MDTMVSFPVCASTTCHSIVLEVLWFASISEMVKLALSTSFVYAIVGVRDIDAIVGLVFSMFVYAAVGLPWSIPSKGVAVQDTLDGYVKGPLKEGPVVLWTIPSTVHS